MRQLVTMRALLGLEGVMKTIVVNEKDQTRVPFLRGILVRSLLDAGLEFDEAMGLASRLRDELSELGEVSS